VMQTMQTSYTGLGLLIDLNWDRVLYIGTIVLALMAGSFIGTM
jgi:hypothetical protein